MTYDNFIVQNETNNYRLIVKTKSDRSWSTAGDLLVRANGQYFSTYDKDNDQEVTENCAKMLGGPFWYNTCARNRRITGITASGENFRWGIHKLQSAEMHLICPQ